MHQTESSKEKSDHRKLKILGGFAVSACAAAGAIIYSSLKPPSVPADIEKLIHTLGVEIPQRGSITRSDIETNTSDDYLAAKRELVRQGHRAMPYLLQKISPQNEWGISALPSTNALESDLKSAGKGDFRTGIDVRVKDTYRFMAGDVHALEPKWRGIEGELDVIADIARLEKDRTALSCLQDLWDRGTPHPWAKNRGVYWRNLAHALFYSGDRAHTAELVKAFKGEGNRFEYDRTNAFFEFNNYSFYDSKMGFKDFVGGSELESYCSEVVKKFSNIQGLPLKDKMNLEQSRRLLGYFGDKRDSTSLPMPE